MIHSKLRKFSLVIAFILMMTTIALPVSASTFNDTKGHWSQEAIEKWNGYGIVNGYDGAFRPNDSVTRAEFATMLDNIVKYTDKAENTFSDLDTAKWYADAFLKLNKAGVINGSDGKALPNRNITRQEAAVMLTKAFHIAPSSNAASFKDEAAIAAWAKDAVGALAAKHIIGGTPDGSFKPLANLTRAEAVTMFDKLAKDLVTKPGEYSNDVQGNLVVNTAGAVLQDMTIAGDLYITEGVGEGEVTLNNVKIDGSVYVRGGGEHSIIFNSVDVKGALVVNKNNGKVRILATGSTSVSVTRLESGALIVTKELTGGGFERIEIPADILEGQEVVLDGNFNQVVVQSAAAPLTANGTIKELVASVNTNMNGNVTIGKVTSENGATATVNDQPAASASTGGSQTNGSSSGGGNTGGSGSGGNNSGGGGNTGGGNSGGENPGGGNSGSVEATVDNAFAAIEAAYLNGNSSADSITSNLNLMTSLSNFPGVVIAWASDNASAVSNDGFVTRSANDQFVKLTATLSGTLSGSKSYNLIVRATGTDNVDVSDFIDPYFVEGYPQAYVENGTIHVRYMLNHSADVYMVVNAINGSWESSVKSVLEGHAGIERIISVDDWPYFRINDDQIGQLQEFDTGIKLNQRTARVDFVIRDTDNQYTSSAVTTIKFDPETVNALDTYGPVTNGIYVNSVADSVYLYYNEWLDLTSMPNVSDYSLNHGTIDRVTLYNYPNQNSLVASYVLLSVNGIQDSDKNDLKLTYTGSSVQDMSDARNKAASLSNVNVNQAINQISEATFSSDRTSMMFTIVPGWFPVDNGMNGNLTDTSRFTVTIAGQGNYTPTAISYGYSTGDLMYTLKFSTPLPVGQASVSVKTAGIVNWAKDPYPDTISSQNIAEIPVPGIPTAKYANGRLELTFASGFTFSYHGSTAAGLVLNIDGREYAIRGNIIWKGQNVLTINLQDKYSGHIKQAVEAGQSIQIKYARVFSDDQEQLSDAAGAFIPDFDYVPVTK